MKILVADGVGSIDSAVVRHLIRNTTHTVVNVDVLTYAGNPESLEDAAADACHAFEQVES